MELVFEKYGPIKLADILYRKEILNPLHYDIIVSLKKVSLSYRSSVLYKMLNSEFESSSKYQNFNFFVKMESSSKYQKFNVIVKKESSLKLISALVSDIGKCNGITNTLSCYFQQQSIQANMLEV